MQPCTLAVHVSLHNKTPRAWGLQKCISLSSGLKSQSKVWLGSAWGGGSLPGLQAAALPSRGLSLTVHAELVLWDPFS